MTEWPINLAWWSLTTSSTASWSTSDIVLLVVLKYLEHGIFCNNYRFHITSLLQFDRAHSVTSIIATISAIWASTCFIKWSIHCKKFFLTDGGTHITVVNNTELSWPTSECVVRRSHVKWRIHNAVHDAFATFDHLVRCLETVFQASDRHFSMGNPNWTNTLKLDSRSGDWCLLQTTQSVRKKFPSSADHLMKCLGAWVAEILAKMLATRWARSHCSDSLVQNPEITQKIPHPKYCCIVCLDLRYDLRIFCATL